MAEIIDILKEYGLDEREAKVYAILVRERELTAYELAKKTGIHRSTTYDLLEKLMEKGFVSTILRNGKKVYCAKELSALVSSLKEKETMLLSMMPELERLKRGLDANAEVLEGLAGQREQNFTLLELFKKGQINELLVISNGPAPTEGSELFIEHIIKEAKALRLIKKMGFRSLWDERYRNDDIMKKYRILGQNRFLKGLPSQATTMIYGDYVSFLFTTDKPYVIRIKNKLVSDEFRVYFNMLWGMSKF